VSMVFPELLFQMLGKELYDRAHAAMVSGDEAAFQAAVDDVVAALRNGPVCTKGFPSSASFGWVDGKPSREGFQSIYMKPPVTKPVEIFPDSQPGWPGLDSAATKVRLLII
jgi:hypothetical protein